MKLRDFLKASLFLPFAALAKSKPEVLVEVVPQSLDEVVGLVVEHRYTGKTERFFVHSRITEGWFFWHTQEIVNCRMNKFWGYRYGDPHRKKELLVIDPHDLKEPEYYRFYKLS